jgi:RNA polymerase sigma-70 factor (ECF subfamily)
VTAASQLRGDAAIVARLRDGDARAFAQLVDAVGPTMLRLVLAHVPSRAVAEEVVQESWISVLRSLEQFEGRSSLRTWICAIAINVARKQAAREGRSVPRTSLEDDRGFVDPDADRFFSADHPRWACAWSSAVRDWREIPEERLLSNETRAVIAEAVDRLSVAQRAVFLLYDVEGWSGAEICNVLELTGPNQRVLLHRARVQLRAALETYFDREA